MTIEQKALELVRAVYLERHGTDFRVRLDRSIAYKDEAICRALEAHELDKSRHAAELREQAERFSEAVKRALNIGTHAAGAPLDSTMAYAHLSPFIIAPVDPLVEAVAVVFPGDQEDVRENMAQSIRAALEAGGLAIVKKEAVNG